MDYDVDMGVKKIRWNMQMGKVCARIRKQNLKSFGFAACCGCLFGCWQHILFGSASFLHDYLDDALQSQKKSIGTMFVERVE